MKIFYSPRHVEHAPDWYVADGIVCPCPEVPGRAEAILRSLAAAGHSLITPDLDPMPAIQRTHDAGYLQYLSSIHATWTAEFGNCDVIPDTFPRRIAKKPPTKPSAQAGYYCFDMAAPITRGTWEASVASSSLAIAAAEAILQHETTFALCRPPGHHAGKNYCGGFCYLNNVAIAAEHLLARGKKRIAILDIDYHHGNGTQDIFYARPDVLFVSIHADPNTQYPYFWGHAEETGEGAGAGCTVNLPLARGASETHWLQALDLAGGHLQRFTPEILLVSFGADICQSDGVGDFGITLPAFVEIGRRLRRLNLPTAFVQEGGYNIAQIGECAARLLDGFSA
ncbi:MAG: histone deacetylase family protein [Phycisphaerae bacterium]